MNHYCLCCEHFRKREWKLIRNGVEMYLNCLHQSVESKACGYFKPRPEPQYSQCVAVLKMLGVEVVE